MPHTQKITFADLGDRLQAAWKKGQIGSQVHNMIAAGYLPIQYLRDRLKWIIERSDEDGYLNFTEG